MSDWLTGGVVINGRRWQVTHHVFDVPGLGFLCTKVIYLDYKSKYRDSPTTLYVYIPTFHFQMRDTHIHEKYSEFRRKWKRPVNSFYCLIFLQKKWIHEYDMYIMVFGENLKALNQYFSINIKKANLLLFNHFNNPIMNLNFT